MTSSELMRRITSYFGGDGKPYRDEVVSEMAKVLERIGDEDRTQVWSRLVEEERSSFKVSVKEIVAACQFLGIPYHPARRFEAVDWQCDACGREFKYFPVTDHEDHLAGTFDFCPRCGFQPYWTQTLMAYARAGSVSDQQRDHYQAQAEIMRDKHRPGSDPYWSPSAAKEQEAELAKERRIRVAQAMDLLARKTGGIHGLRRP